MTVEIAKCAAEAHPDLLYIQITAWGTVALVIATIGMIVWQILSTKNATKVQLSLQLMEKYDSPQMRANRQVLAAVMMLQPNPTTSGQFEPIADALESVADLRRRSWLDAGLIENTFSVPVRYWWHALKGLISKMRDDYHDTTIYERFEQLAVEYDRTEAERKVPPISQQDLNVFLKSEAL